jgi:hypothetical protein
MWEGQHATVGIRGRCYSWGKLMCSGAWSHEEVHSVIQFLWAKCVSPLEIVN